MTGWSTRLLRKYLAVAIKPPRNPKLRHHKYAVIGASGVMGAVALGNVNSGDNIVVGARGLLRFVRSIKIGLTISLDYYFSMIGLTEDFPNYEVMMSRIHQRCAIRIKDGCLQNGGTYIKLGQGLVSLSHFLPREYIDTLKILQDKCIARDKEELYQVFEEDFGETPEELFRSFDIEPIAAASIAQVFKATTKDGQEVAVKVQYNDLRKRLASDVMTINILLKFGAWMHPKVDFTWILNDFVDALKQELDFVNEGLNGERCAKELKHLKYVYVPRVLWNYTKTRVLVTEFVEGTKISDQKRLKENGFSLADINNKLFEAFGHQIFQTGFVHADPHPGNIMIRKRNGQTELIILDHGLYQKVSDEERIALSHMWKAIVFGNHEQMQRYSKILGVDDYCLPNCLYLRRYSDMEGGDIYVTPPRDGEDTDIDSDQSDDDHKGDISHLGPAMLRVESEFVPASICNRKIPSAEEYDSDDNIPLVTLFPNAALNWLTNDITPSSSKKRKTESWTNQESSFNIEKDCTEKNPPEEVYGKTTPLDFFDLFFDEEVLYNIEEQTNIYAQQKNPNLRMTRSELLVVFGGLLLSGYGKYPNKRMYWSNENDVPKILSESMRLNRFELILRYLHLNDNSQIDNENKLYRLQPLIDKLNRN